MVNIRSRRSGIIGFRKPEPATDAEAIALTTQRTKNNNDTSDSLAAEHTNRSNLDKDGGQYSERLVEAHFKDKGVRSPKINTTADHFYSFHPSPSGGTEMKIPSTRTPSRPFRCRRERLPNFARRPLFWGTYHDRNGSGRGVKNSHVRSIGIAPGVTLSVAVMFLFV